MRKIELENWALRVLDNVTRNGLTEDHLVELKGEWLPAAKLARRLAGHANAARGDYILWLIGVDEKTGEVRGAKREELSSWWSQMESEFADGIIPEMTHLNMMWDGKSVVALFFKTDRVPYVVRNPEFGKIKGESIAWEVPLRKGTGTKTATRNELILLLTQSIKLPACEVRAAELRLYNPVRDHVTKREKQHCELHLDIYAIPNDGNKIYIPEDRCEITIASPGGIVKTEFERWVFNAYAGATVERAGRALLITGPCGFGIIASVMIPSIKECSSDAFVDVRLRPVGFNQSIVIALTLRNEKPGEITEASHRWLFNGLPVGSTRKK